MSERPPLPPFNRETAAQKVQAAEDAWNTCDPERVALAYSDDSVWRNRDTFITGRAEIVAFLTSKWARELDYALRKNLRCFEENRIAVRFQYECHDRDGQWWRSYGNELWEFDEHGLMGRREARSTTFRLLRATGASSGRDRARIAAKSYRFADRREVLHLADENPVSSDPGGALR